jgi:hypothetical protein
MSSPVKPPVRQERTHWRDAAISQRHRLYGWDAPALDIDFLMLEYDSGRPAALVEYKAEGAQAVNVNHPSMQAIRALANSACIPFLIVFYSPSKRWCFHATPMNDFARRYLPHPAYFSERDYVLLLYRLRGRTCPPHILNQLNTYKPDRGNS